MPYLGLYVQLRRGSVAGYTTDESWAYRPKEGVEAFESITLFIRFIYAINLNTYLASYKRGCVKTRKNLGFQPALIEFLPTLTIVLRKNVLV